MMSFQRGRAPAVVAVWGEFEWGEKVVVFAGGRRALLSPWQDILGQNDQEPASLISGSSAYRGSSFNLVNTLKTIGQIEQLSLTPMVRETKLTLSKCG